MQLFYSMVLCQACAWREILSVQPVRLTSGNWQNYGHVAFQTKPVSEYSSSVTKVWSESAKVWQFVYTDDRMTKFILCNRRHGAALFLFLKLSLLQGFGGEHV